MEKKIFDLKKRVRGYALEIIRFLESLPKDYISQTMGKQLLRSATSVGANIVEAQSSSSRKDFINFYTYSLKSANESKFWLSLLQNSAKSTNGTVNSLVEETNELANILASSILSLKGKKNVLPVQLMGVS